MAFQRLAGPVTCKGAAGVGWHQRCYRDAGSSLLFWLPAQLCSESMCLSRSDHCACSKLLKELCLQGHQEAACHVQELPLQACVGRCA